MSSKPTGPLVKKTRTDKVQVYWVSYLDGVQRVLLFTQDERIAKKAIKVGCGVSNSFIKCNVTCFPRKCAKLQQRIEWKSNVVILIVFCTF